jgi:hypothetical protein
MPLGLTDLARCVERVLAELSRIHGIWQVDASSLLAQEMHLGCQRPVRVARTEQGIQQSLDHLRRPASAKNLPRRICLV